MFPVTTKWVLECSLSSSIPCLTVVLCGLVSCKIEKPVGAPENRDCVVFPFGTIPTPLKFWHRLCTLWAPGGKDAGRLFLSRVLGGYPEKKRETRPYP